MHAQQQKSILGFLIVIKAIVIQAMEIIEGSLLSEEADHIAKSHILAVCGHLHQLQEIR